MASRKLIPRGEKVGLKLSRAERALLLEGIVSVHDRVRQSIRDTPPSKPVLITLDHLGDLARQVAGEANHAKHKMLGKTLDRISQKIEDLLDRNSEETDAPSAVIPQVDPPVESEPTILPMLSRSKKGEDQYPLKLTEKQREALIGATRLRRGLKNKIGQTHEGTQVVGLTRKELDEMAEEVETALAFAPGPYKRQLVAVRDQIDDLLDALEGEEPFKPRRTAIPKADRIYQLKITLKDISPPIWRRVQVPDCTLGDLHEVIQTVMGWKDCHLHQFIVNGEYYGAPDELDLDTKDEDDVLLGQVIKGNRRVRFRYDYDFAAGWQHEVVFEQIVRREPEVEYPRCVDGERACPPEGVGGPSGYADLLDALADPKHEGHEFMREWIGDEFDPERFDVNKVNKGLRRIWSVLFPPETTS